MVNARPAAVRVSVVQAAPEYPHLGATLEKTVHWMEEAARQGSQLVCFGETWLPGYPAWLDCCPEAGLWNHPPVKEAFATLRANSVSVTGEAVARISAACARLKLAVVIGVHERVDEGPGHGTLYNTLLIIAPDGRLAVHHRKLMPTYTERLVWGQGDGRGLEAADAGGVRVGALICWEHWMPLARQALHDSGEHIHVALWPTAHEMHQVASRHYAFEGRCFVLASGQLMRASAVPQGLGLTGSLSADSWLLRGGSAIIAPDGRYLAGPVFEQETLLTADLDLAEIDREVMTLDVSGHYARPDVFDFRVRKPSSTS